MIKFTIYLLIIQTTILSPLHPPIYISNKDLKNGPYIITKPGTYILSENIIFDPPQRVPLNLLKKNRAFHLGFFAAIIIQSKDITLDLNNFSITQSDSHYLHQRFYSHIELGSAPFVPKTGPHDFTDNFIIAKNVIIKNGVLGLSAHHGIHGNNCENIFVSNLVIKDFEVGAVSINGGKFVEIDHVEVGPTSNRVAFNGLFSAAKQIKGYVESLVYGRAVCGDSFLQVQGRRFSSRTVLTDLKNLISQTEEAFLSGRFEDIPELLRNKSNLPDGSALYGFVFHSEKPAVNGFNDNDKKNNISTNIVLKNIVIKDFVHNTIERFVLQKEGEKRKNNFEGGQIDPRGSFFNVVEFTDHNGNYISNPLGNAQLLVSKYKKCLFNNAAKFRKLRLFNTNTKRDSISKKVLNWARYNNNIPLNSKLICNADQMLHAIKGTIPLRLSGISKVYLENITIENIKNETPFGSKICGNYRNTTSFKNSKPGYLGADLRGITIESCSQVEMKNIDIFNLSSKNGKVFGVDVMFKNKDIKGDITVSDLKVTSWKNLPEDFYLIPQSTPFSVPLFISNESECDINICNKNSFKRKLNHEKSNQRRDRNVNRRNRHRNDRKMIYRKSNPKRRDRNFNRRNRYRNDRDYAVGEHLRNYHDFSNNDY